MTTSSPHPFHHLIELSVGADEHHFPQQRGRGDQTIEGIAMRPRKRSGAHADFGVERGRCARPASRATPAGDPPQRGLPAICRAAPFARSRRKKSRSTIPRRPPRSRFSPSPSVDAARAVPRRKRACRAATPPRAIPIRPIRPRSAAQKIVREGRQACPRDRPIGIGRAATAPSLTTGLPPLAMMTSSPASAAWMSLDKWVFAASMVTCMATRTGIGLVS